MSSKHPHPSEVTKSLFPADMTGLGEARVLLEEWDGWILDTQVELTAIPAPPFGEEARGERMGELFTAVGLTNMRIDQVGNVLAELPGRDQPRESDTPSGHIVLSAHLDTVFPPGTETAPRISGEKIRAPGIADDGRGLAALLALGRVLTTVDLPLPYPVLFVATVGEEGVGNLRGVRHLFGGEGAGVGAQGFISLDGVGLDRIITRGVGSTRLRIWLRGPGGHSWTDWGLPNPMEALARVVTGLETLPLPNSPRTTATVARWGGGKSINAIPEEAWVEVDLRSEGSEELLRLEESLLRLCARAVEETSQGPRRSKAMLELEIEEIGRRPAGQTAEETSLVQAARDATLAVGAHPTLNSSSTDANVPMALGIPAITMGAGGKAGGIHTLEEWYSNWKGPEGILRALLTLVLISRPRSSPGR